MKQQILILLGLLIFATANGQNIIKPLDKLLIKESNTWFMIQKQIKTAKNLVTVLPKNPISADSTLYQSQVTTRSAMGAIIYETGGLLIDSGWIRILGSGNTRLNRTLMSWNKKKSFNKMGERPSFLLIADDVLGGFYAINAGGIDTHNIGKIFYFSPDDLQWNNLQLSYSEFLDFCFSGDLNEYYRGLRWVGWKKDLAKLDGNYAFTFFPSLWSKEGRKDINMDSKKIVLVGELWDAYFPQKN